jgi:hypothetical protein
VKNIIFAGTLVMCAVVAVGCGTTTGGQATASDVPVTSTSKVGPSRSSTTSSMPTTGMGSGSLADVDPCSLLDAAGKARFGTIDQAPGNFGSTRGCDWHLNRGVLSAGIYDTKGMKDLNPANSVPTPVSINGRPGTQLLETDNTGCEVAFPVTDTSRVQVDADTHDSAAASCGVAVELAKLIEPKIPKG